MKLKKQKIVYWISTTLIDIGVILLVRGYFESGKYLNTFFLLSIAFLFPGIVIAIVTQRCPFCKKFLGIMFFSGKKKFCPYCGKNSERWESPIFLKK